MLELQRRLLTRAAEVAGGWNALCFRLGVSEHSVKLWIDAKARMPDRVFFAVTDLVLKDDIARAAQDRRVKPRATTADSTSNSNS
jgi:DNA-binding transcriptional regulator YdaS (Cro superfamily)